ncbi:mrpl4p [Saccharomyces arboricola H-6]|uniref:Large ribosomal subunit protein uL29m n=1 Tax=Saccharomyces arboricola (strain H-6 / AS 2.3317 / CBS 10644) TaxID=1160507 RepID=J8LKS8_SACAR|nr:mrpl4p [Saccharomyces arboricola H-6]
MWKRSFHSQGGPLRARTKFTKPKPKQPVLPKDKIRLPTQLTHHNNNLKVTDPIPPTAANLHCSDDHPLWQFFSNKKFIRSADELPPSNHVRPWSIPELRHKSFDDLHSLWYNCLREQNVLARENHLLKNIVGSTHEEFGDLFQSIRTTMWQIRHVLNERDLAHTVSQEYFQNDSQRKTFLDNLTTDHFLNKDIPDDEIASMITRFQLAVFGISETIQDNTVDVNFVDGIKFLANLKLQRFKDSNDLISEIAKETITDVGESFILFTSDFAPQAVQEACVAIQDLRKSSDNKVPKLNELSTVRKYLKQLIRANSMEQATA